MNQSFDRDRFRVLSIDEKITGADYRLDRVHGAVPVQNHEVGCVVHALDMDLYLREIRALMALPTDAKARKGVPIYSGFIKYFPKAIAAVARLSQVGNDQHNPGQPLHWDRSKSGDELDALGRHLLEAEEVDADGVDHLCKVAWRSMAALEKRLEKQEGGK